MRDFAVEKGAKTQEYFVYFKFEQRFSDAKDPHSPDGALIQRFLKLSRFFGPTASETERRR